MSRAPARAALLGLVTAGCVHLPRALPPDPALPPFPALAFFAGGTEGRGLLRVALRRPVEVRVTGHGRLLADGTLLLEQEVVEGAKPARRRQWRIAETAPGRVTGTLSDAAGPVAGETGGGRLHLAFAMPGGLRAEQWLTLAPDRRTARNLLAVRWHGLPVARLDETIRRADPLP